MREAALTAYLDAWRARVFDWNEAHCCTFAGQWVRQIEGLDPLDGVPPVPSARDGARVLSKLGGSLRAAVTLKLSREHLPPLAAAIGDVVLDMGMGRNGALGICNGRTAAYLSRNGLEFVPLHLASACWRVAP